MSRLKDAIANAVASTEISSHTASQMLYAYETGQQCKRAGCEMVERESDYAIWQVCERCGKKGWEKA